jgi:hypothetical protein
MQDRLEKLIKLVYKGWKADHLDKEAQHPDEEALVCFIEGRLTVEENDLIKEHLIICDNCAQAVAMNLAAVGTETKEIPEELLNRLKHLLICKDEPSILEIILKLKEKTLEVINATGDVLVGLELVPAPVLRNRSIKDFKDEVTILKNFKDIRVEVKIENKGGREFNLNILVRQKQTLETIKDLRVMLIKDDLELESYLTDSGTVIFEHVLFGKYVVEISTVENKLASILLDIKV